LTHPLAGIGATRAATLFIAMAAWTQPLPAVQVTVVRSAFIDSARSTPSVHASTIVETRNGLLAAWFGGTREGSPDVAIWASRETAGGWTHPVRIADGVQDDGSRYPCYNPVLFAVGDTLFLFYKVGPEPQRWWGMVKTSVDAGETWSAARRLPDGLLGPIKNKPVRLPSGRIVSGSSTESHEANSRWRVHFELSDDNGRTWRVVRPDPSPAELDAIQPSILQHGGGRLQAVGRTRQGHVFETWSSDNGEHWSALARSALPNPNAGTDAVTLHDGRQLIVYNNTTSGRSPLNVALSANGASWSMVLTLEQDAGEYSYPAVIQTQDGLVHVTYTWRRERIRHVVLRLPPPGRGLR
jgi:predicted neuraminidase